MFVDESTWIQEVIGKYVGPIGSALDIGYEGGRILQHPHIEDVHNTIRKKGATVETLDLNPTRGATYTGDLTEPQSLGHMPTYDLVLCCSILEHVIDIGKAVDGLRQLAKQGSYLLVTAPQNFPPHPEPIDNGFRPDICEVIDLFPDLDFIQGESFGVRKTTYYEHLMYLRHFRKFEQARVTGALFRYD